MSGSLSPFGPGMGSGYTNGAVPMLIDPVTGVPMPGASQVPQAPMPSQAPAPQPAQAPPPGAPPAPLQMNLPPASLPFSGPQMGPGDLAPPAAPAPPPPPPQAPPPPQQAPAPQPAAPDQAPPPQAPDGISNNARNNPLNLRFAGQDGAVNVGGFAAFPTQDAGVAAAKNQFALDKGKGIDTLRGLVSSWAPKNENDTDGYIQTVSGVTGISPDAKIDITDPAVQAKIIPAMSLVENGPAKGGSTQGGPPQGAPPVSPAAGSPPPMQAPTPAYMASQGFPTANPNAYVGGPGDQLLAIGAGLGGASSLGRGFAAAGQNVMALGERNQADQMKVAQFGVENNRLNQQMGFQNAQMGLRNAEFANTQFHQGAQIDQAQQRLTALLQPKPTGVTTMAPDGKTQLQELRSPTDGSLTYVPMTGTSTQQQRVNVAQNAQSGQPALIKTAIADNQKRANEIDAEGETAVNQLPQLANFQTLLNSGQTGAGATAVDQFKRYVANKLGIPVGETTPDSANLAQALSSQLVNGQVSSSMRGLGLRSNNEFNTFKQGMTGLDKNPATLNQMIDTMQKGQEYNRDVYYQWHSPDTEAQRDKLMLTPGGLSNWEAPMLKNYAASRGVGASGPATPTVTQDSSGAWKPTTATLPGGGNITIQRVQ